MINLLVDHEADVGLVDKLGRTPLYRSARLGYGAATKLSVDRGLVITAEDNDGRTACDLAESSDLRSTHWTMKSRTYICIKVV